jgi:hypothetical protein
MARERFNKTEEREKPLSAWIMFGEGGHEGEYVLNLENCDINHFIPLEIESEIKKELGKDWYVDNRGTRIEIVNKKVYGSRDDENVHSAIKKVLIPHGYLLVE